MNTTELLKIYFKTIIEKNMKYSFSEIHLLSVDESIDYNNTHCDGTFVQDIYYIKYVDDWYKVFYYQDFGGDTYISEYSKLNSKKGKIIEDIIEESYRLGKNITD